MENGLSIIRCFNGPSPSAARITEELAFGRESKTTVYNVNRIPSDWEFLSSDETVVVMFDENHKNIVKDLSKHRKEPVQAISQSSRSGWSTNGKLHIFARENLDRVDLTSSILSHDFASTRASKGSNDPIVSVGSSLTESWIDQQLDTINRRFQLAEAETVVIKPNLAAGDHYSSGSGVVTDLVDLKSTINVVLDINEGVTIRVVESDSIGWNFARNKFENQNYEELVSKYDNVELCDITRSESGYVEVNGLYFDSLKLAKLLLDADVFISLAKIKTHQYTTITGSVKNLFGCLPTGEKKFHHPYLDRVLPDLLEVLQPDISILDGNPGLKGDPISGTPQDLDRVLIGSDALATDIVMASILGHDPAEIDYIQNAAARGSSIGSIDEIEVKGELGTPVKFEPFESPTDRKFTDLGLYMQQHGWIELGHEINHISNSEDIFDFFLVRAGQVVEDTPLETPAKKLYHTISRREDL